MKAKVTRSEIQDIAIRSENARKSFVETLMTLSGCNQAQAERVMHLYLQTKIAKLDYGIGRIAVKHGAYLDKQTIWNVINL